MRRLLSKPFTAAIVMTSGLIGCASPPPKQFTRSATEFTPCSSAPHCVSSQADRDDSKYVAPFAYKQATAAAARQTLLDILGASEGATVERAEERFIHATFRSTLGFVDDVTFIVQPQAEHIDVKSSSRLGYYDFGVNRKRVEQLRARFNAQLSAQT
ncbi:DUF1499 domain-containing protein [Salinisphaera sp. C84B14]|uniref:DUF1499 domain-containing protein n=1 Tax=Salinisphaera sp. C84B14 TaxID=1304155 RepID=UPI003342210E